ncbi:ABC-F family ATP-binding cassette domain-containing protein [Bacteroidales bacterium]
MVSIQNLSMHFTGEDLFSGVNFLIRQKDRIGLTGKNGAGKTTLLKLLMGIEIPHKGEVIVPESVRIGYLPQEKLLQSRKTVLQEALEAFSEIFAIEKLIAELQSQLAERTDYLSTGYHQLADQLSSLNERLALLGSHSMQGDAEQVLAGLGFSHLDMERQMSEFSNGWQMRVELAKLLLKKPELLLLDEPTNHLDIEAIQWLEQFLESYYGAVMLVSHDRAFLDNVTKRTVEISKGKIYDYKCSYSEYVEKRLQRIETLSAAAENQQKEIKEIERFIERFRYKATKAKQVQSRIKLLEKMDEILVDEMDQKAIHFKFPPAPHSGNIVLNLNSISKSYDELQVLKDLNMTILRGEKVAFVGRNGEGKSTLAKIIAGVLEADGEVKWGHLVKLGYYAQNQHEMLDLEKTVFETLDDVAVGDVRTRIKGILGAFLFSGEAIEKKVKVLSGGEKARLSLAKMLLEPTNLLVLDEPTNHLDMQSKDILKNALIQYDGALIIVSHDRDFLAGLTEKVYEFRKPLIREYIGDIYDFLRERELKNLKELELSTVVLPRESREENASEAKLKWERKKNLEREKRKLEKEVERIENEINTSEYELKSRDQMLANPANYMAETFDKLWYENYERIKQNLADDLKHWEQLHTQLDDLSREIENLLA